MSEANVGAVISALHLLSAEFVIRSRFTALMSAVAFIPPLFYFFLPSSGTKILPIKKLFHWPKKYLLKKLKNPVTAAAVSPSCCEATRS